MALVGEAHIVVRAITTSVERDIRRGFSGLPGAGSQAGASLGKSFSRGFNSSGANNVFSKVAAGLRTLTPGANAAKASFYSLLRTGYTVSTMLSVVIGGASALGGSLVALAGSAGGAIGSLATLGNVLASVGGGMAVAKFALGGIGKALGALNRPTGGGGGGSGGGGSAGTPGTPDDGKAAAAAQAAFAEAKVAYTERVQEAEEALARVIERNRETLLDANNDVRDSQLALNEALKEGREEIQQLGFDAEDAALAESKAAIELDKARETLLRTQDLPPNSRLRQEAELAYQEADLNLRKAKDRSADLNKEQDRLARTGVQGTEAVISATKALAEAEAQKSRDIRDGLRDEVDAIKDLNKAKADKPKLAETESNATAGTAGSGGSSGGGGGGGINPFEGLNEAQIKFVKFLQSLKPLYDELKKTASEAFLPPLQEAIQLLADKLFPTLNTGVGILGRAMGAASISIAQAITETENLSKLGIVFKDSGVIIEKLGKIIGNVWGVVLSSLVASGPLAIRFVSFLEKKTGVFDRFLNTKLASGELQGFFARSGQIAAQFGTIFSNIFRGIGDIIEANFGPGSGGDIMIQWLIDATEGFATMGDGLKNAPLKEYFQDVAENGKAVFQSIGALLDVVRDLGANSAIKETFDTLATGAPALGRIMEKSIEAGPALARLVVSVTEIIDAFTDTGALEVFFDTLQGAAEVVNELLGNEVVKQVLVVTGLVHAFLAAIGLIGTIGLFAFKVLIGSLMSMAGWFGKAIALNDRLAASHAAVGASAAGTTSKMGRLMGLLGGPWMVAIAAIGVAWGVVAKMQTDAQTSTEEMVASIQKSKTAMDMLNTAGAGLGREWGLTDVKATVESVGSALQTSADQSRGFGASLAVAFKVEDQNLINSIQKMGDGLAELATTDLPAAQGAFSKLTTEYNLNERQQWQALNTMSEYKAALMAQATELGVNVTEGTKAENQQALLGLAMGSAETSAKLATKAFEDNGGQAAVNATAIENLGTTITDFASRAAASLNTESAYQQAIDDAAAQWGEEGFVRTLDLAEQAGRDNTAALLAMAEATSNSAAKVLEHGGTQADMTAKINEGKTALFNQARQFFETDEQAQAYVDTLVTTPEYIKTEADLKTEEATRKRDELIADKTLNVNGNLNDADAKAKRDALIADKQMTVTASIKKSSEGFDLWKFMTTPLWGNSKGGLYAHAIGGLNDHVKGSVQAFANGGMAGVKTGMYKGRTGAIYKFAEPETKWEAFISGKPGQEARNIKIWEEAGRRLGVLEHANGGIEAYKNAASGRGGANGFRDVIIHVHATEGMDKTELATEIGRELKFLMRKGSV